MSLTEAQRANLKRARFSPILLRVKTHRRAPAGPGDMRVLRGLATLGLRRLPPREAIDHAADVVRDALCDVEDVVDLAAFGEVVALKLKVGRVTLRKGVPYYCPPPWLRSIVHGECLKFNREMR